MTWLILGVLFLLAAVLFARWFSTADHKAVAKTVKWCGVAVFAALVVYLTLTKKFLLVPPLAVLGLFLWRRINRGGGNWIPGLSQSPSSGQSSVVETPYLRMSLDHDSGTISGEIRKGRFMGKDLSDLTFDELMELLSECRQNDSQSAQLIEAYLDRVEGSQWRNRSDSAANYNGVHMTRKEAFSVLGLEDGASDDEIRAAHHRLILKIHPDQGGSNYLAAKINQAKEFLLGS